MSDWDLEAVLTAYGWDLPSPRTGWVTIRCQAHDDSHQSCRINIDDGYITCLACGFPRDGKAGDSIDVIRYYEGWGFHECKRRAEELTQAGGGGVSRGRGKRGPVPSGTRGDGRNRKYVPPRVRHLRERASGE